MSEHKLELKRVTKKFRGHKREHEYFELTAEVEVPDNGYRKLLPPFVLSKDGEVESYPSKDAPTKPLKLRFRKYVIPGYYKDGDFELHPDEDFFEKFFLMSYQKLCKYVSEFNYEFTDEEPYSLNFYPV